MKLKVKSRKGIAAVAVLAALLLVEAVRAYRIGDTFRNIGWGFESFLLGGWQVYETSLMFTLLFTLFFAAFYLALKKWYGDEKGGQRQVAAIALVFAIACSLAIVIGLRGFGMETIAYIAAALLVMILFTLIYAMLLKLGLENRRFWAFILAAIITALILLFARSLFTGDGMRIPGIPAILEKEGRGPRLLDIVSTGGVTDRCTFSGTSAYEFDSAALNAKGLSIAHQAVSRCVDDIVVYGYASKEGEETYNEGLSERRAKTIKDMFISAGKTQVVTEARGETWEFSVPDEDTQSNLNRRISELKANSAQADKKPTKEDYWSIIGDKNEKGEPTGEKYFTQNRAFKVTCRCAPEGSAVDAGEGEKKPNEAKEEKEPEESPPEESPPSEDKEDKKGPVKRALGSKWSKAGVALLLVILLLRWNHKRRLRNKSVVEELKKGADRIAEKTGLKNRRARRLLKDAEASLQEARRILNAHKEGETALIDKGDWTGISGHLSNARDCLHQWNRIANERKKFFTQKAESLNSEYKKSAPRADPGETG